MVQLGAPGSAKFQVALRPPVGSIWDPVSNSLILKLVMDLQAGTLSLHMMLRSLIPPLALQFDNISHKISRNSESKSIQAAGLVLSGINYSLCLDAALQKDEESNLLAFENRTGHNRAIRLLLIATFVLISKTLARYVTF